MFQVHNQCGAPQSFVDTVYAAYPKIEDFAKNAFGIDRPFWFSDVFIIDRDDEPPKTDERYSIEHLRLLFDTLLGRIEELISMVRRVPDWKLVAEELMEITYAVYREEINDYSSERETQENTLSKNDRIKKINERIKKLPKIKKIAEKEEDEDEELADLIEEILKIWKETSEVMTCLEYPITRLGYFIWERHEIFLCYKSICDDIEAKFINEYGEFVFAHECFHALHYGHARENIGIRKWDDSLSVPSHIHCRAVHESLAEYFSLEYASHKLGTAVYSQAWKVVRAHPFPNWGYAGAQFFNHICQYGMSKYSSLFNAVYYASIIDMDIAYRILESSQSENKDFND